MKDKSEHVKLKTSKMFTVQVHRSSGHEGQTVAAFSRERSTSLSNTAHSVSGPAAARGASGCRSSLKKSRTKVYTK